eukprot:6172689-Pleurochrysis_carterae.AAC.1
MVNGRAAGLSAEAEMRLGGGSKKGRSADKGGRRAQCFEGLGSEARALRKYACDASPKRQTVH